MRDAMAHAVVGDDIYADDPTMIKLEKDMADLLGKEKALFTTSGTQANLIAMMLVCPMKGESIIFGDNCHLAHYERGGIGSVAGVMPTVLVNKPDGTLAIEDIQRSIFPGEDPHIVKVRGISLESSMNNCNGKAIRPEYFS
jgi:threonine aldolase